MSSTTRRGEATASAFAINSRSSAARPARFSSCVSSSVSNDCKRDVKAALRSQILPEPMSRKVGILGEAVGVVDIFIPGQSAVHRLPQQVDQRQLGILAPAGIAQVPLRRGR